MKKRNLVPQKKINHIKRDRDPIPWRYCILTLACGLLLATGFFWAATQHFSAMDLSMKNAKLREQKQNLEDEGRRLYLSKQNLISFDQVKKAAQKFGMQKLSVQNIQTIGPNKTEKNENTLSVKQSSAEKSTEKSAVKTEDAKKTKAGKAAEPVKTAKNKSENSTANSKTQIAKK